jgi:hypothetical protein
MTNLMFRGILETYSMRARLAAQLKSFHFSSENRMKGRVSPGAAPPDLLPVLRRDIM